MATPTTELDARFSEPGAVATSWDETRRALESADLFWICTVRRDGRPHVASATRATGSEERSPGELENERASRAVAGILCGQRRVRCSGAGGAHLRHLASLQRDESESASAGDEQVEHRPAQVRATRETRDDAQSRPVHQQGEPRGAALPKRLAPSDDPLVLNGQKAQELPVKFAGDDGLSRKALLDARAAIVSCSWHAG